MSAEIYTFLDWFDAFIQTALNRPYHPQLPAMSNGRHRKVYSGQWIPLQYHHSVFLSLEHSEGASVPEVDLFFYRFPQTGFYLTVIECDFVVFKIIENRDLVIFMVVSAEQGPHKQYIAIRNDTRLIFKDMIEGTFRTDQKLNLLVHRPQICGLIPKGMALNFKDLKSYLQSKFEHEYNVHPIHQLVINDQKILSEIDKAWAHIRFIDAKGDIDLQSLLATDLSLFMWLQEVYLHLGRFKALDSFYSELLESNSLSQKNKHTIIQSWNRFKTASQNTSFVIKTTLPTAWYNIADEKSAKHPYLNAFVFGKENLSQFLQEQWQTLCWPAFRNKLKNEIDQNPDAYMAFISMAYEYCFWWATQLYEASYRYFSCDYLNILKLLLNIKLIINQAPMHSRGFQFASYTFPKGTRRLFWVDKELEMKITSTKKTTITSLLQESGAQIVVDKPCKICLKRSQNTIKVDPHIVQPPIAKETFWSHVRVKHHSTTYLIPLVWPEMTIYINRIRIKFLLKKRRYQVSLKFKNMTQSIEIEGKEYKPTRYSYVKTYLPVTLNPEENWIFDFYTMHGIPIRSSGPFLRDIQPAGVCFDRFGQMHEQVRIHKNGSSKSIGLDSNVFFKDSLRVSQPNLKLDVRARHCDKQSFHLVAKSGLLYRLLNESPASLKLKLVFYLKKENEQLCATVSQLCKSTFGFLAMIKNTNQLRACSNAYAIYIDDTCRYPYLEEHDYYAIIKLSKHIKGIFVRSNHIEPFFTMLKNPTGLLKQE